MKDLYGSLKQAIGAVPWIHNTNGAAVNVTSALLSATLPCAFKTGTDHSLTLEETGVEHVPYAKLPHRTSKRLTGQKPSLTARLYP